MPLSSFKILSLIILTLALPSCEKDCLEFAGDDISISQEFANFTKIEMYDTFTYHLIQDSANYVELRGKENLIKNTEIELQGNVLSFRTKPTCTLFKGYHDTEVYIHFKEINEIYIEGNASIYSEDTLYLDNLFIENKGDFATWDIIIKAKKLHVSLQAIVGEMIISGVCDNLSLYSGGTNHCFFEKLECNTADINHSSLGNIYLTINQHLNLQLLSSGNFFCYGKPDSYSIDHPESSKGAFIFKD